MINESDADFHPRNPADKSWTETAALIFSVPEAGILGNVYVQARPNLGVALSQVIVGQGFCRQSYEIDLTDAQYHLTCPPTFRKFTLENGLSVENIKAPADFHFVYKHALGACNLDLKFQCIHQPFDPHDLAENPLLAPDVARPKDARMGDEWMNGHYEVKGHITGTLELRGKTYTVDSYDGMDRSWGPRTQTGVRSVSWISINFGRDFAMHLAVPMNIVKGDVVYDPIRFGYVVDHGKVLGIVDAQVTATRVDLLPFGTHIRATDAKGRKYELFGSALAGHPWHFHTAGHVAYQSLMRYELDGKIGYGEFADIFGTEYLAEHLSRHGRKR